MVICARLFDQLNFLNAVRCGISLHMNRLAASAKPSSPVTLYLSQHTLALNVYAFCAAFMTYFSMYGFRRPVTAAQYRDFEIFGVPAKIIFVTCQTLGYMCSKFGGIQIISELKRRSRGVGIVSCIVFSEGALIIFGFVPPPYNAFFMFLNGLPLGLIWGLVFSFIEGRLYSDILATGMCVSFIVASGCVKSVGGALLQFGFSEFWMPAATGAIFFLPLVLSTYALELLPDPNEEDIRARTERVPMTHKDRMRLLHMFGPGIGLVTVFYMGLSAFRDFRDNFSAELWKALGYIDQSGTTATPAIYASSETIVGFAVVVPIASFMFIRENINKLIAYHVLIVLGVILVGAVAILQRQNTVGGLLLMVVTGIGVDIAYIPFSSMFFDVIIAAFRYRANIGFLMYLVDSMGYLSSVVVLFVKNFGMPSIGWVDFFDSAAVYLAVLGTVLMSMSLVYFVRKYQQLGGLALDLGEPGLVALTQ
jgi:hypothetical protein